MNFSKIEFKTKMIMAFLIIALLPLLITIFISYSKSKSTLKNDAFESLTEMTGQKTDAIKTFFHENDVKLNTLAHTVTILKENASAKITAIQNLKIDNLRGRFNIIKRDVEFATSSTDLDKWFEKFKKYHDDTNTSPTGPYDVTTDTYKKLWKEADSYFSRYVKQSHYPDIILACAKHGHIMYTHQKYSDLGKNAFHSKLKDEGLARIIKKIVETKQFCLEDYSFYSPIDNYQGFAGGPIKDKDGKIVAVFILPIPTSIINKITQSRGGLGRSGESYIVGQDLNGKTSYRTDRVIKNGKIGGSKKGKLIDKGLNGQSKVTLKIGSSGAVEMVRYDPVRINGLKWMMNTSILLEEVIAPQSKWSIQDFYTEFVQEDDFDDLFLFNSQGYCFYSVSKEADYHTNLATGKYKDSSLGKAVNRCLQSKKTEFGDVAPYEPSNGEPACFLVKPILRGEDNEIEVIVGLQMSDQAMNNIMVQGSSIENETEFYLVGEDRYLRSDTILNKDEYNVRTSFANNKKIETHSVEQAFQKNHATNTETSYAGEKVLSANMLIDFFNTKWVLIADKNTEVAFASVKALFKVFVIILIIAIILIVLVGLGFSKIMMMPIVEIVNNLKDISEGEGDLTRRLEVRTDDELGSMAKYFNLFVQKIENTIKNVTGNITVLASSSEELSATSNEISSNSINMTEKSQIVSTTTEDLNNNMTSVSAATEEISSSINTVASAIEEMSASLNEVAGNCTRASEITQNANSKSAAAGDMMNELNTSANEIGKVLDVINDIADQTNLLALNATIEAASAGDAGKGFAVVATEVKELAKQTAEATEEIGRKIEDVQNKTKGAVDAISEINKIIIEVNDITQVIAAAIEEQSSTTGEISGNISGISNATVEVSNNIQNASQGSSEILGSVRETIDLIQNTAAGAEQASASASELEKMSANLKMLVEQFKTS